MINEQWLERIFPLNGERLRNELHKQEQLVAQLRADNAALRDELMAVLQAGSALRNYHDLMYQLDLYKSHTQTLHFMNNKLHDLRERTKPSDGTLLARC